MYRADTQARQDNQQDVRQRLRTASPTFLNALQLLLEWPSLRGVFTRRHLFDGRPQIAERLLESQHATATLTTFNEADMSVVQGLRTRYNEQFEKRHGVKLGFMSVFVKAAVAALKAFPLVNARIDGNDVVYQAVIQAIGLEVQTQPGERHGTEMDRVFTESGASFSYEFLPT